MRRTRIASLVAVIAASAAALTLSGVLSSGSAANSNDPLDGVRKATSRYRTLDRAINDGYVQFFGCVHEPLAGSMGIHFVNGGLVGDASIDAAKPEALMYEESPSGKLELTGAEYVVFQEAWDAANTAPPELFGQPFNLVPAPNRYGIAAFYELHAWAWKANPTGANQDWNPKVICAGTEGHTH